MINAQANANISKKTAVIGAVISVTLNDTSVLGAATMWNMANEYVTTARNFTRSRDYCRSN